MTTVADGHRPGAGRRLRRRIFTLLALAAWLAAPPLAASPCSDAVQGVIAWDGRADTRWDEGNLDTLCRGAEDSLEPTHCFRAVMSGRIEWGGGTRWNPRNALNLCRGSRDARATLRCFIDGIDAGDHWRDAIANCQADVAPAAIRAAQMPPADDRGLPIAHSFGTRDGEFRVGEERVYRTGCANCQVLYCAPGDEILSHGGACGFGAMGRQYIERRFDGPCAGVGCWSVTLSCRGARSEPLTVIESRPSIQARCVDVP